MKIEVFGKITLVNGDCMEYMRSLPDNAFDLAVVDPPYGNAGNERYDRFGGRFKRYRIGMTGGTRAKKYGKKIAEWDVAPPPEYFKELFRVSKNQIIWGANYFPDMPPTRCFLIWRKLSISENFTMAMAEYAWTSFDGNAKVFDCAPQGMKNAPRFHPTQKPIALYKWLMAMYAKEGDKILDTHLGSGSSAIAAHELGFALTGIEIEKVYYEAAKQRLVRSQRQGKLF